jgi:hypothetical protein
MDRQTTGEGRARRRLQPVRANSLVGVDPDACISTGEEQKRTVPVR